MQEESRWRYVLAQQIAPHYHANPKVAAVLVEGSVALGYAARSSDIDLSVFWADPPTGKERRDIIKRAGKGGRSRFPFHGNAGGWSEEFEVGGVAIDVRHIMFKDTARTLAYVLARPDASLPTQHHAAM